MALYNGSVLPRGSSIVNKVIIINMAKFQTALIQFFETNDWIMQKDGKHVLNDTS